MNILFGELNELFYGPAGRFPGTLIWILLAWQLLWKGISLWKSARNNQRYWYVALLLLNTLGVLDLIYLAFFQRERK